MKPLDILWWFRYLLAIAVAGLCSYLDTIGFFGGNYWFALLLAVGFYLLTYPIALLFRINPKQLPKKERDLALYGVFAYFIAWFVFWILFYTLTKLHILFSWFYCFLF
ncbi:MAG: hypothetical protein DRO36_02910 [Candidatus Hecatellales archaeon]|nr:MAG: hypothetical protein DRO36_02910 [Candidatus Hecatellales archaeon]